ncbi:MAG: phosphomannomutase, partial [Candidatus Saccharimonadales bacterium]
VFASDSLAGKQVIVYQHSAVGRDLIVELLQSLGAEVVPVGRSDVFVPIDTENVTDENKAYFTQLAQDYPTAFAIVSTDGDSDRPFVIDETGTFHRGDVLGCVVANFTGADFAAVPVSANDAVQVFCKDNDIELVGTKIGSPYVIVAMQAAAQHKNLAGWEVNGGFLMGSDVAIGNGTLKALPTRDAVLPILAALLSAAQRDIPVSRLFSELPKRYTGGGLLDNVSIDGIQKFLALTKDSAQVAELMQRLFEGSDLGAVTGIDLTDGVRLTFASGDVMHFRPSGNAPQFRIYTTADTQERADDLTRQALQPGGYIEKLLQLA